MRISFRGKINKHDSLSINGLSMLTNASFSETSARVSPIESLGIWIEALIMGSLIVSISEGSGR